jgi:hypothetical protein
MATTTQPLDESRPTTAELVTYLPLDVPKDVAPGVWVVDSGPLRAFGMPMPVRMTIVRLANGELLLHSPTQHTVHLQSMLQELGQIRHLVAPNIAHWTFAQEWQRECAGTVLWAAPKLAARRQVRRAGLRIDRELSRLAPAEWRGEISHVLVEGAAGFREIAMFHKCSGTLVLTDLVVNLEPNKLPWLMGLLMRIGGSAAPDGGAPFYLRLILLLKRSRAREAALHLLALSPQRVIFAHGAWFEHGGAERLRQSLRWLVGNEPAAASPVRKTLNKM